MARHYRCDRGHEWQVGSSKDLAAEGVTVFCPVCAAAAKALARDANGTSYNRTVASLEGVTPSFEPVDSGATLALPDSPPPEEPVGLPEIAGYEVLDELGRGAMGVVYKARHLKLNRLVALKMVLAGSHASSADLVRFLAEAEAAAQLQHPHIVQVHEIGKHVGLPFLSLEFVDGGNLAQKLQKMPLLPHQAAEWIETLARSVEYAHQHGIIHRDLKPGNVLLTSEGVPKITDFGLAKRVETGVGMTQTGVILGTPSYMAPEQAEGKRTIGPATDTYALGAILYEMLTGRPPFQAPTPLDTVLQVIGEEPVPPRRLQSTVPRDLETICLKCLQKDPRKRYAGAEALADDLRRYLDDKPILARPVGRPERAWRWCRRNPWMAGMSAAVLLLLTVLAVGALVAAVTLGAANKEIKENLNRATTAEQDGLRKLAQSYLDEARARRYSRQAGQRFASLEAIAKSAEIIRAQEPLDEAMLQQLRDEAIACMALPDLQLEKEWEGCPAGTIAVALDNKLEHYARRNAAGEISIRRVADDEQICLLPGMGDGRGLRVFRFSPDGRLFAATSDNGPQLNVWSLDRPDQVFAAAGPVHCADFTPDSKQIVFARDNNTLNVATLATGRVRTIPLTGVFVHWISVHPDGRRVALSTTNIGRHSVEVRSLETGELVGEPLPHPQEVGQVAWHPNGNWLAAPCDDRRFYLWDVQKRTQTAVLEGYKNGGLFAAFNPAGDLLATNGWESSLRFWDPKTGKELLHSPSAWSDLRFSRDGRRFAAGMRGTKLSTYRVSDGQEYRTLVGDPAQGKLLYNDVAVSPDNRLIAVGMNEGGARLWDLADGRELALVPTGGRTPGVLFHASGDLLTGSLNQPGLQRWPIHVDPDDPELRRVGPSQTLYNGAVERLAESSDGKAVAFNLASQGAAFLNPDAPPKQLLLLAHPGGVYVAASPDGRYVATGTHGGSGVKVWKTVESTDQVRDQSRLERTFDTEGGAAPAFSPDGRWLAVCTNTECRLWRVGTWEPGPRVNTAQYATVVFSPQNLLTVSVTPTTIGLVDPDTGRILARLEDPYQNRALALTYSPDGSELVITSNDDQAVHVWNLRRIREGLQNLGLDWSAPAYPPAPRPSGPMRLKVIADDMSPPIVPLPPSQPGAPAATPQQIAEWIQQLGDSEQKTRNAAAEALAVAGTRTLKALAEAAPQQDQAVQRRINEIKNRIAVADALAPIRIRLKLQDAPLVEAVAALSKQAGVNVAYRPQVTPDRKPPPKITLTLDDVPFWEALDLLCQSADLTFSSYPYIPFSVQLTHGKPVSSNALAHAGPFRMEASQLLYQRSVRLQGQAPSDERLYLNVDLLSEPNTRVWSCGQIRLVKAEDANGSSLLLDPPPMSTVFELLGASGAPFLRKTVGLRPPPERGGKLKRLAGVLPVEVVVHRRQIFELPEVAKGERKTFLGPDRLRVQVQSVQQFANGQFNMEFILSSPGQRFDQNTIWAELIDNKGKRHRVNNFWLYERSGPTRELEAEDLIGLSATPIGGLPTFLPWSILASGRPSLQRVPWQGNFQFFPQEPIELPLKLVLYRFERLRTELPFEFHDLPLP